MGGWGQESNQSHSCSAPVTACSVLLIQKELYQRCWKEPGYICINHLQNYENHRDSMARPSQIKGTVGWSICRNKRFYMGETLLQLLHFTAHPPFFSLSVHSNIWESVLWIQLLADGYTSRSTQKKGKALLPFSSRPPWSMTLQHELQLFHLVQREAVDVTDGNRRCFVVTVPSGSAIALLPNTCIYSDTRATELHFGIRICLLRYQPQWGKLVKINWEICFNTACMASFTHHIQV